MKKSVVLGISLGAIACGIIIAVYFVTIGLHEDNSGPVETEIQYTVEEEQSTEETSKVQETTVEESTAAVEETSEAQKEDVLTFIYGDTDEVLNVPINVCESFNTFIDDPSVSQALGVLLFDTEVEWNPDTYVFDGTIIRLLGDISDEHGIAEFVADSQTGICEISFSRPVNDLQTIDNFTKPASTPTHEFGEGDLLSDMPIKTVTTVKFDVREIVDWDGTSSWAASEAPDTVKVVLENFENKDIIMENYNRYHHLFGDGTITVWNYEKLSSDVVVFYSSIGGWNVAYRVWDREPYVIQATAQPNGTGN